MGNAAFNQNTFKVKLKMALSRINLNRSKVSNELTIQKKTVAEMIINGKEENARIRAEGVIRQQNMIFVFEHVSLICELLIQRISLIAKSDVCPTDLFGPIATLIYATKRIEIPELFDIVNQIGYKFGREWANGLVDSKKHVNKKLLEYLSLDVPSKKLVSETMSSIAKEYDIDWSPSPEDLNEEPDFEPVKRTSFVIPKGTKDEIKSMDEHVDRGNDDRSSGTDPNSDGKMSTPPQYSPKSGKREVDDELEDLEARFHALKSK